MIINITKAKQIVGPQKFEGEYTPETSVLNRENTNFNGPVKVLGTYEYGADEIVFTGNVSFALKTLCDRCGADTEQSFNFKLKERFIKDSAESDIYSFTGDKLDLSLAISEFIMINLPVQILCTAKCKGLCEVCGKDLNSGKCKCKRESSNAFAVLKDIKKDN